MNNALVPGTIQGCLEEHELNHRPVLISVDTDFSLDGQFERQWLVVTSDHLNIVGSEGQSTQTDADCRLLSSHAWSVAESFRTVAGVGSGLLQMKSHGHWVDMLRFSNGLANRFHKVSRCLEQIREAKANGTDRDGIVRLLAVQTEEPIDPPRCPSCSLRLSTKEESCPRCMEKGQILGQIGNLLWPHRRGALVLCGLTVLGVIAELVPPKLQQYMVDHILNSPTVSSIGDGTSTNSGQVPFPTALLVVVLALAFSRILLSLVSALKGQISTAIGTGLTGTLREQMVQKLQRLAVAYYDRHQVGSMLSRVAHDSEVLHGLMHQLTGGFLLQTVQLVGVGAMLLWLNPKLAMFTLIPVPLVIAGSWVFWRKVYPRYYRLWDASSRQMSVLGGMLSGIRVVKAFAQEDREFAKFQKASDHLKQWRQWVEYTNAWYSATMSMVFSLGGLIVWYIGGRDVIGNEMTLGELIAFLAYLAMFYAPLSALSNFTSWLTSFLSGSKRVLELLDTPVAIQESLDPAHWPDPKGRIEFRNVTFGYDRNQPVIKDVSFQVTPGEMIGIVGRSGSGKTTMVNLLGRFYDVQEGSVLVDGIDIRELPIQTLRQRLGIVFQDSFLFRGTIWKNLSFGRPSTSIEEGLVAAKAAGAHDFIMRQSLGYETMLGEHGAGLSGGEKQRLSIARTLLYDPRILILDEATSNIDAEAEKCIQEALEVLIHGRTTIAIAHRLSTLRNADRILVFDRGRLIEEGSHFELLSRDGTYARLVRIQTQVSRDANVDRLLWTSEESQQESVPSTDDDRNPDSAAYSETGSSNRHRISQLSSASFLERGPAVQWLDPSRSRFQQDSEQGYALWIDDEKVAASVFIVAAFPASQPESYLSVRQWTDQGEDEEIGIISQLQEWSPPNQACVRRLLRRRYLLRQIEKVEQVKLRLGFLEFEVQTQLGKERFLMRWTQSQAIDFGERGKLITDTEENRYVVADVERLPKADREKFLQYVYW
jgi:ATP-binding cassette subfamily B protein